MTDEKNLLGGNEEKPLNLKTYKPEGEIFQRLHLCEYLRELSEIVEDENKPAKPEKKDFRRHPR